MTPAKLGLEIEDIEEEVHKWGI